MPLNRNSYLIPFIHFIDVDLISPPHFPTGEPSSAAGLLCTPSPRPMAPR